ncbi:MAG: DegT/DnrJ/EryC1/StrS family aminotransferase [Dysgonamonadaceae bacterium]|nr:DegT/DnrJ/EryC1/StrS family aminotransferase [Dysgonamonadaceae bacterium]
MDYDPYYRRIEMIHMQFRDLKAQYQSLKPQIDQAVQTVLDDSNFISGRQVQELEESLAAYTGVKHCITCVNGTDALSLPLMTWGIKSRGCGIRSRPGKWFRC